MNLFVGIIMGATIFCAVMLINVEKELRDLNRRLLHLSDEDKHLLELALKRQERTTIKLEAFAAALAALDARTPPR